MLQRQQTALLCDQQHIRRAPYLRSGLQKEITVIHKLYQSYPQLWSLEAKIKLKDEGNQVQPHSGPQDPELPSLHYEKLLKLN